MDPVTEFENKIAAFFGAPFAICVDSCTHGIELCLRLTEAKEIYCPKRTYLSVPMLAEKLGIYRRWVKGEWKDYYYLTENIIDAAVLWREKSYIPTTFMCISFQYQKHLSVGRLGVILCDKKNEAIKLKMMAHDGRLPNIPWREQNISVIGYHYYPQRELCQIALDKLELAINTVPRQWVFTDWPLLTSMKIFSNE